MAFLGSIYKAQERAHKRGGSQVTALIQNSKRKLNDFVGTYLIGEEEIKEVLEVLEAQSLFRYYGPNLLEKVTQFEEEIANFMGSKYSLAVNSGTSALKAALIAIGIKAGDEVIVPAYGFFATASAVVSCQATPVFVDINHSMNLDPDKLDLYVTEYTRAIIVVHIQGVSAQMDRIKQIANHHHLYLIEDVAQAFSGEFSSKKLGTIGDIGCFSFQANKILVTGEGGAIITDNENLYLKAKSFHDLGGVRKKNEFPCWDNEDASFGENFRMSELNAAVGIAQIKKIPLLLEKLKHLKRELRYLLIANGFKVRDVHDQEGDCSISECVFIEDEESRDFLIEWLNSKEVHAHGMYHHAIYEYNVFNKLKDINKNYKSFSCINAENLARRALWIPISPMSDDDYIKHVIQVLIEAKADFK